MTAAFTAGSVLTATNLNNAVNTLTVNAQTAAGYSLVLTDGGKLVTLSNASAQNLTIPLNSSVAFPTGTVIEALNIGAGTWTVTATGGVTLSGNVIVAPNNKVTLIKTGTDTWWASITNGGPAWTSYTPFSVGGITVGNGTALYYYTRVGKVVHFRIHFTLGSTSAITGDVTIYLPTEAKNANASVAGKFNDTGTGVFLPMFDVITLSSRTYIQVLAANAAGTYAAGSILSATVPFTWTTGDIISIAGTYEEV